MRKMSSRNKILMGAVAMLIYMVGDYLLGLNTVGTDPNAGTPFDLVINYVPDWRYAGSCIAGFIGTIFYAIGAFELVKVLGENKELKNSKLCKIFKIANLTGILFFAFMHNCMSMMPVVYNAGFDATGDAQLAIEMFLRVGKSIIIPLALVIIIADLLSSISWIGLVVTGKIPVKKIFLICNPLIITGLGQIIEMLPFPVAGIDSGFESLGWMSMYLVCAFTLT